MFDAEAFIQSTAEEPKEVLRSPFADDPAWKFINETTWPSNDYWIDKAAEVRGNRPEDSEVMHFTAATLKQYGLTYEQYQIMLALQDSLCAICKGVETVWRGNKPVRLSIDHDHRTGKVRGLLCQRCNSMLGFGQDDPSIMRAAADYLDEHKDE